MKSSRALIMIFFSLIAGVVAVWFAARWVTMQASENSTAIVVAKQDLDPGSLLTSDMLTLMSWPNGAVPEGAFTDLKKLDTRVVAGSVIYKGEALLEARLAPEGASGGLSSIIPAGMRAISIHANEIVGVAGYIRPGSMVDIMVNTKDQNEKPISKIVLEKILVLATAQDDKRDQNKPKVVSAVTLQVDPAQAEKIDLARSIGTLSLILRNPLDKVDTATDGARRDDLMAGDVVVKAAATAAPISTPPKPKAIKPQGGAQVEVIRGVQKANSMY